MKMNKNIIIVLLGLIALLLGYLAFYKSNSQTSYIEQSQSNQSQPDWIGPGVYLGVFFATQAAYNSWYQQNYPHNADHDQNHDNHGRDPSDRGDHAKSTPRKEGGARRR
jgi:hypothetical protein